MKFLLGPEPARLSGWLKILNYDSCCFKGSDSALLSRALREDRVVLSSKSSLSYSNSNAVIFNIKSKDVKTQLKELKDGLGLRVDNNRVFLRCIRCNIELNSIKREEFT